MKKQIEQLRIAIAVMLVAAALAVVVWLATADAPTLFDLHEFLAEAAPVEVAEVTR